MNQSILPNTPATVSTYAQATGGIDAGHFIEPDIDPQLFNLNSVDTPLMNLMMLTKETPVNSPEVDHYIIDAPVTTVKTTSQVSATNQMQVILPLETAHQKYMNAGVTLLVHGVDGYTPDGQDKTPGKSLMLYVVDRDTTTNNAIVRSINGPRANPADEYTTIPKIPAESTISILSNALYETQMEVAPDIHVPQSKRVYLQKRGMNQVVSDYFDAQRKRIPFSKSVLAEQAIAEFKARSNRTLWAGRPGKFKVNVAKLGMQYIYTTEGLRWQFSRELQAPAKWTVEHIIGLAKMFFTGEDKPKTAIMLAGKDIIEQFAKTDFSEHPEIRLGTKTNRYGWTVQALTTVFGDIEIVHEPTLDTLGWSTCAALIGEDRIAHYVYRQEHSFKERMPMEEAERSGVIVWDGLALKGTCHIWIDGSGATGGDATIMMWDSEMPPSSSMSANHFYLLCDCPGIDQHAKAGQIWTGVKTIVGSGSDRQEIIAWQRVE